MPIRRLHASHPATVSGRRAQVRPWVAALLLAGLLFPATSGAAVPQGPAGDEFYAPPQALVAGESGTMVWARPASPITTISAAASSTTVIYRSRNIYGDPSVVSGQVFLPKGDAPAGGWPVVAWSHVTTGAADRCAPSRATAGDPELDRMLRGNAMAVSLLNAGVAVVRSDYEGLGTPGPHPYLIGASLARSTTDMVRAAHDLSPDLSRRWVAAGHSEGGVSSLFTGARARALAPEFDLRGVAAVAPALRSGLLLQTLRNLAAVPGDLATLPALASIVLTGAAVEDPELGRLFKQGALSDRALALLPDTETRCLADLTYTDSWGGLAPKFFTGEDRALTKTALARLDRVLNRNDARNLTFPRNLPVRLDQGVVDPVTLKIFADEFVLTQWLKGKQVTYRSYPTATHANITDDRYAVRPLTAWILSRLS
ncbi:MAG: hypothetical protein JHD16_07620 [Solirubrobacteraceae bacterium]|nr:hypothetical protein [Solirubrobacteraceae bacterium]